MTVGFDPLEYVVSENDGNITLNVRLLSGTLERDIVIDFNTPDDDISTSAGVTRYCCVHGIMISLDIDISNFCRYWP